MAIIISKGNRDFQRIEKSKLGQEADIQEYILAHPELLPVEYIKDNARVVVLARELKTASGNIDAFGVDSDGEIYIIETKLGKNTDKRQVVAQAFDYGAALWQHTPDFGVFLSELNRKVTGSFGVSFEEKIKGEFGLDDEGIDEFKKNMRTTLTGGTFKFVILMDEIDDGLKDLIVYINTNSNFSLYGVETEFYRTGDIEVVIPRLYGAEVRKENGGGASGKRTAWTEDRFFEELESGSLPEAVTSAVKKLYDYTTDSKGTVFWGTGAKTGSFTLKYNKISLINVFTTGEVGFPVYQYPQDSHLKERIETPLSVSLNGQWPYFKGEIWADKVDELIEVLENYISKN